MNKVQEFMGRLHNRDLGILFVRLALGIVFIHAGWLKLNMMNEVVAGFASVGFPAFLAYLVAYVEFIGGILMVGGVLVRYAGVLLSIVMLVAMFKVHFVNGYGLQKNGFEYVLLLLLLSLAMMTLGEGKYSILKFFKK